MIYTTPAIALATNPEAANAPWIGYRTVVAFTNITADEAATGFPVTNLANTSTAEFWRGTTTDPQGIVIAEGNTQECDYFALAKHNLGSTGATLLLQTSPDGVTWTDVTEEIAPADDYAIMYRFDATQAAYWRLYITPGTAAPQAAILFLGLLLVAQRSLYVNHTPLTLGRSEQVTTGLSEDGQFLGRILRRQFLKSSVALSNLTPGWYRTHFDPFAEAAATRPCFWAWRPGSYPLEVGYAWLTNSPVPSNQRPNGMMQVSFEMQGVR
jgi:hypothetical protein